MKTLYFEGAGWSGADSSKATVGNCRIRTAFHLDDGQAIYLELGCCEVTKHSPSHLKQYRYAGHIDYCHYITDEVPNDDENKHRHPIASNTHFEYNHEEILKLVNSLGASFDEIKVLPDLSDYRVHADYGKYNFADEYQPNMEYIARAEEVNEYFRDVEKKEGKKYPNFSLWADGENPALYHLLRHFNGYNKHWLIDVSNEDWQGTIVEAHLGKYGC